jgi:hypothetical protein
VVLLAIWFAFPDDVRAKFNLTQILTLVFFGAVVGAVVWGLMRCRVDLDASGMTVVNGYTSRRFEWAQVVAISLAPGSPWAVIDLSDGTTVSALGIQGSDGALALRQVAEVREFIHRYGNGVNG